MRDSPRLFKHFARGSAERTRVNFVLSVFALTLFISSLFLVVTYFGQKEQYDVKLSNLSYGFPLQIRQLREQVYPVEGIRQQALRRTSIQIFSNIMDRKFDSADPSHNKVVDELVTKFLTPISFSQQSDDESWQEALTEYSRSLMARSYPVVYYRPILIAWAVAGVIYWLVIFSLYNLGLNPGVGEPAFNIIDVGFLAVLVQYTGGLFSPFNPFILVYWVSLLFASLDLGARKDDSQLRNRRFVARLALVLGPYILAMVFGLFWATSERLLAGETRVRDYILQSACVGLVAASIFSIFYITGLQYFTKSLVKPYSQASGVAVVQ